MNRDLNQLAQRRYDVLIIGGGIYGVCAAWDAALRGLSVALLEKSDFAAATSSNSLRIVHGGLRYLQHADFRRMRQSIRERMVLMRIAPHLVHPLPFLMPTYGHRMQGKEIMSLALSMNDLIGCDRNRLPDPQKHLPRGRVISRSECLQLFPGVEAKGLTGGAIWYDCQMYNSERMLFSVLRSAIDAGATAANYVEVTGFLMQDNRVTGVQARNVLTDEPLEVGAKVVLNTSGPWVDRVLGLMNGRRQGCRVLLSKAMNIVVKRQLVPRYAVGISGKFAFKDDDALVSKGSRLWFITPWHNYSLIGTTHAPYNGTPDDFTVREEEVQDFLHEVNEAYPAASLKREDVGFLHVGLLPMHGKRNHNGHVSLIKQFRLYDHRQEDGIEGLVSVVSVKYTTARDVAQRAVDLVCRKLGKRSPRCITAETSVHGGQIERFEAFLFRETRQRPFGLHPEVIRHLVYNYGAAYPEILKYFDADSQWGQTMTDSSPVIKAEVLHGIREEMAQKLTDVVFRRTELGIAGDPGETCLQTCAAVMAAEMGWDEVRTQKEVAETKAVFATRSGTA